VSGEEWGGMPDEPTALIGSGAAWGEWTDATASAHTAGILAERLRAEGAEVLLSYADGDLTGVPAVTRNRVGEGAAWYLGTVVSDSALSLVIGGALAATGVEGVLGGSAELPEGLEAVRRGEVLFLLNHSAASIDIPVPSGLVDLLTGENTGSVVALAAGDVRALSERHDR
jgi:beta-galactosidase